jgi:shikimate kinase
VKGKKMGEAEAIAYGAATIVNAIATGKGAAFGVNLWTKAKVKLTDDPGVAKGRIISDEGEKADLIEKTALKVLRYFGLEKKHGAYVETDSNIPVARGLKSSSAAANAVALATLAAAGKRLEDIQIVRLGVEAALEAKVTITGAFDDACASFFGNVVVTDNAARIIERKFRVKENYIVLFHVPPLKAYTAESNVSRIKTVAPLVEIAYREALSGNYWSAMTLNGLIYSAALGYNPAIAIDAILSGAISAGLSGKGPAVAAVVAEDNVDKVKDSWEKYEGQIMQANINREKAKVVRRINE